VLRAKKPVGKAKRKKAKRGHTQRFIEVRVPPVTVDEFNRFGSCIGFTGDTQLSSARTGS